MPVQSLHTLPGIECGADMEECLVAAHTSVMVQGHVRGPACRRIAWRQAAQHAYLLGWLPATHGTRRRHRTEQPAHPVRHGDLIVLEARAGPVTVCSITWLVDASLPRGWAVGGRPAAQFSPPVLPGSSGSFSSRKVLRMKMSCSAGGRLCHAR
jgi:hypothetical protein